MFESMLDDFELRYLNCIQPFFSSCQVSSERCKMLDLQKKRESKVKCVPSFQSSGECSEVQFCSSFRSHLQAHCLAAIFWPTDKQAKSTFSDFLTKLKLSNLSKA